MGIYNKLIRDRIPKIIFASGKQAVIRVMDDKEYRKEIRKKLYEELEEYLRAEDDDAALEELADMLELIHVLTEIHGSTPGELEMIRAGKAEKRGGFKEKLFLERVMDE
ncbi:nucleoside triphosphate pyrophosphohydrolase [Desmospora profundinema]|uniref:House-cleaning noncanonical NTP pyrophosphatase (MazG superfamily) n=1 Tax=Desmospora profundinema TaxID=1571184 RepID=A0ABU1IIV2_9BACL|nr:nucleoside triphosphate pyrophosphohydrolase [Desmospora profundinema]MDR6224702.1 putative house-cleaning noncanonical NTP pyrophosphatase (MazG superfamily) [Desmospora profundinema]